MSVEAEVVSMPPVRRKKGYGRWVALGVLGVVIALIASTVRPGHGALTYSRFVEEVMRDRGRYTETEVNVEGNVDNGTLRHRAGTDVYDFQMSHGGQAMPVHYRGDVADVFREGITVVVRGRIGGNGTFAAQELITRCPSRYEMQQAAQRGERMPGGAPTAL